MVICIGVDKWFTHPSIPHSPYPGTSTAHRSYCRAARKPQICAGFVKDFGSDINSKVLAFAFGLAAEIERDLISQRTKEALAGKRAGALY